MTTPDPRELAEAIIRDHLGRIDSGCAATHVHRAHPELPEDVFDGVRYQVCDLIGRAVVTVNWPESEAAGECPTCQGRGMFAPLDGQPGERCPYCPHLYPAGRMATGDEINAHLAECDKSSLTVVTVNAELHNESEAK